MPLYEYQCQKCSEITEVMQKFSEAPLRKCPGCGGRLTKLMSMNNFQLKGSGWYVTDYRKSEAKADDKEKPAPKQAEAAPKADEKTKKAARA
ncbi:MAG: zinc ribbon domain-containing protein [Deltaproteobacteria bacterium]|nr:zinc ribbon domain-containing protein [Deltaproteobacteria bacterium]